jgi:phage terminase large subunit GpA-like protein
MIATGIDMQMAGFWYVTRAFYRSGASWLIDYGFLMEWTDVENYLFGTRIPVDNRDYDLSITRASLDIGGGRAAGAYQSRTEEAYYWLLENGTGRGCRVFGVRGNQREQATIALASKPLENTPSGKPLPGSFQIFRLDTGRLKDEVIWKLGEAAEEREKGAFLHSKVGKDYAKQILAEEKRINEKGLLEWVQIKRDNHFLDCEVYCMALAHPEWPTGGINIIKAPWITQKEKRKRAAVKQKKKRKVKGGTSPW